jgi:hypothetical protein
MEEAFYCVHGHYINQQNSKLIEHEQQLLLQHHHQKLQQMHQQQLQQEIENRKADDEELEKFFATSSVSIRRVDISREQQQQQNEDDEDSDEYFMNDDSSNSSSESNEEVNVVVSNKENNPPQQTMNELTYLDLDVNSKRSNASNGGLKRRIEETEWETEDAILSILPKSKQFKACSEPDTESESQENEEAQDLSVTDNSIDNSLELDFLSSSKQQTQNSCQQINNNNNNTTVTPLDNTNTNSNSSIENIDRITSLVSIFNFGNLQRTVSTSEDLCSSQASKNISKDTVIDNNCCNLNTQRQYLAMTV